MYLSISKFAEIVYEEQTVFIICVTDQHLGSTTDTDFQALFHLRLNWSLRKLTENWKFVKKYDKQYYGPEYRQKFMTSK